MRAGEFPDGAHVLRAKIDLASTNMLMRDPILVRIRHAHHYRTGDEWCIYPLYDYAHPIEDAIECVTHSLCTLEFENNREFYDWDIEHLPFECRPEQTEFARLALDYTVLSKRKLLQLVQGGHVSGWDDPRMPTLAGLRRRGVTPEAIRLFCDLIGVAKANSRVDIAKLEYAIREDLNQRVRRVLCVVRPLKVVITNYPADQVEHFEAPYYPHDVPLEGNRSVPFARELYIDREDFMEDPPKGYFRLAPGREVRLRYAYIIRCAEVIKDAKGEVIELRCSYNEQTRGGGTADGRTVKGTIHWVSARHSLPCEVRLYDRLFRVPDPDQGDDFKEFLNPDSLVVVKDARIEPSVAGDEPGSRYQFERVGYFCADSVDSRAGSLVFNRTVTLRDSWAKASDSDGRPDRAKASARPTVKVSTEKQTAATEVEILARDADALHFFQHAVAAQPKHADAIAKLMVNELPREMRGRSVTELPFGPGTLAQLVDLIETGAITGSVGKEVLAELVANGGEPAEIVQRKGLSQISDVSAIDRIVVDAIRANPDQAAAYRAGRTGLLGFFVGQVMSKTGGRANPKVVSETLERRLAAAE
jgi:glutaminyl-tRNA synthetase